MFWSFCYLSFCYLVIRRVLQLAALRLRSNGFKELGIVVLRHELAVLRRQVGDFGYEVVDVDAPENAALVERVPVEILNPRIFFEKNNRLDEYKAWVANLKEQRKEFLEGYEVDAEIIAAVTG